MTKIDRKNVAAARKLMRAKYGVQSLLSDPSSNPKTDKNSKRVNILTAPLHLAPFNLSGFQVCPRASAGCAAACLHTAGNPVYMSAKEKARIARTRFFFGDREAFLLVLRAEIAAHERKASKRNMFAGVRLNATSDISWERFGIMEAFPDVTFYDYTKIEKRMQRFIDGDMPTNYYLTFSATEDNEAECINFLSQGGTVAMVFSTKRKGILPQSYKGFPVIDADVHDYRPADPKGVIAGLRAKGDAIGETSGFVRII